MKNYDEWSSDELWDQVKMNFSAHMLIMYSFLRSKGIKPEEFTNYIAEIVIPDWKSEVKTVDDFMNAVLLNVAANGGVVRKTKKIDNKSEAIVSQLLEKEVLRVFDLKNDDSDQLWNKFIPIANSLNMIFSWNRIADGDIQLSVSNKE